MTPRSATHATAAATIALAAILASCTAWPAPAPTSAPTVRPTPTPVPGATTGPAPRLEVSALNFQINPPTLLAQADSAFVIHFRNLDPAAVPHVVDIRSSDGATVVQEQKPIMGGEAIDYDYGALPPGDYIFICRIHPIPAMSGTLAVR